MGAEEVDENSPKELSSVENDGSEDKIIEPSLSAEETRDAEAEQTLNEITYRTDYVNFQDDSFIGSITASSPTESHTSPLRASPDVLEIVTTIVVTKASQSFFKKFKDEKRVDTRKDKDFMIEGFEFGYVQKVEMIIHSRMLIDALRAVIDYYPGSTLFSTNQVKIPEPFSEILHYRDEIEAFKANHPSPHGPDDVETTNRHIDILLSWADERFGEELRAERQRYQKNPPTCTYQMLWLLFKPGELCYFYPAPGQLQAMIAKNMKIPTRAGSYSGPIYIFGWSVAYDGQVFGREPFDKNIAKFVGEKEISTLDCFPARFFRTERGSETADQVLKRLVARGQKYWKMRNTAYSEYRGTTAHFPYRPINNRIMVDPLSCFGFYPTEPYADPSDLNKPVLLHSDGDKIPQLPRFKNAKTFVWEGTSLDDTAQQNPGCPCHKCAADQSITRRKGRFSGYYQCDPSQPPPNYDEYFSLCSYRTFVFDLAARKWEVVNVESVDIDVEASNVFDDLVLPREIRTTIFRLAKAYEKGPAKKLAADIIRGKGLGTIFLLHGPPGVGKTATAESVAELTNKPLLSLTCGDLGNDAGKVELNLNRYLNWGLRWGAVVLLDEADVFLEQRDVADVERNSLVSVFLRALEYYSGFLFLTTNRVNTFDEAFISRIHVALEYKALGPKERGQIWDNNIRRLKRHNPPIKVEQSAQDYIDDEVVELDWNGREIRNAFQTATALAQYDADNSKEPITLKESHLRRVVGLASQFHRYLASVNQDLTQSDLAYKRRLRNDKIDAQRARSNRAQPRRNRNRQHEEYDHDDEYDDRRVRRAQNTNPRSLPTRFVDDYAEDGRSGSNSKRGLRTPESDDEVDEEWSQRPKAAAQSRERYEDEEDQDDRGSRRRADRRPAASGKKASNREAHESDEEEADDDVKDKGTEPRREGKPRRT